jgi:hypothetical protein
LGVISIIGFDITLSGFKPFGQIDRWFDTLTQVTFFILKIALIILPNIGLVLQGYCECSTQIIFVLRTSIDPKNSGKSQLLRYMILKNKKKFSTMFLVCPTEKITKFYYDIFKKENVFETYSDNWIKQLMDKMAKANEGKTDKESKHILLVLDDVCSDTDFHHSKTFKQIFFFQKIF